MALFVNPLRLFVFVGLLVCLCTGCTPSAVWVFVDNSGDKPLVVRVDDKEAATIAPGEFSKLVFPPGEYRFHITSGEEVLCDLVKKLEKSDRVGSCRKILFNPDKGNRYQIYTAKYGVSRLAGVMETGLLKYQKDENIKRQYIYKQLLKEVKLVSGDAWNDVTGIDHVLTPPPEYVRTKGTARRTVLWRIEPDLYERMERMNRIEKPTEEDIESLDELLDEILSEAP